MSTHEIPQRKTGLEVNVLRGARRELSSYRNREIKFIPENLEKYRRARAGIALFPEGGKYPRAVGTKDGTVMRVSYRDPVKKEEYEDIENVSKSAKEVLVRWNESETLPEAIRMDKHITGSVLQDIDRIRKVNAHIRGVLSRFQTRDIASGDDIKPLALEAAELLVGVGYDAAVKPEKKDVFQLLMDAAQRKDKLGRPNPQMTRVLFSAALLKTISLFDFYPQALDKSEFISKQLGRLNEKQRFLLGQIGNIMFDFSRLRYNSHEFSSHLNTLVVCAQDYLGDSEMYLNPYRKAAIATRLAILGPQTGREEEDLLKYGVNEQDVEALSTERGLMNAGKNAREKMLRLSYKMLGDSFQDGDDYLSGRKKSKIIA